jgi:hypothetical protein
MWKFWNYLIQKVLIYHKYDIPVAMCRCKVKGSIITHVSGMHPSSTLNQHLHNLGVAPFGCPVKRRELVVISGK